MKPLEENRSLLAAFRNGEPEALDAVFRLYGPYVAKILRHGFSFQSGGRACRFRGSRSTFDLEDRLHDVFARAFTERARLGYDGLTPYERYVSGIARNLVIDDFRKKEHALVEYGYVDELPPASDETSNLAPDPVRDPEAVAADRELRGLVADFKTTLKSRERTVYGLRFEEELEHAQIAERTGLSASKIKTSERRIREGFFSYMRKHGYFTDYEKRPGGWLRSLGVL